MSAHGVMALAVLAVGFLHVLTVAVIMLVVVLAQRRSRKAAE